MRLISSFLERAAKLFEHRTAIVDDGSIFSFIETKTRVDKLSSILRSAGLRPGDRVAVLDVNSYRYLEVYYACAQAGVVIVPINIRLSAPEIRYILTDSEAKMLALSEPFFDIARNALQQNSSIETILSFGGRFSDESLQYEDALASAESSAYLYASKPDDICSIYYTSGTTGEPKGVCLTYANMTASAWDSILSLELNSSHVWLHAAPMFHLVDAWAVWSFPLMGAAQATLHFDPERFMAAVQATRATSTALPPTLINMVASHPSLPKFDLSSLQFIMYGGAPTPLSILERATAVLPARFIHAYGITETSGITTVLPSELFCVNGSEDQIRMTNSAGYPVANLDIEILNSDGERLGPGEVGEVTVSGPRVMKEYWRKAAQTSDVLKGGRYHTGDMGFLDDENRLFVVDRKKDMIISGGENVYSVEVENVIASHPAVLEVAVIGVPDDVWGEAVKAIVTCRPGASVLEDELLEFCRGKIAGYKIPKSVDFSEEPLPKLGPGKIAKRRLREPFWSGRERKI